MLAACPILPTILAAQAADTIAIRMSKKNRQDKSEALLRAEKIKIGTGLPGIDDSVATLRTADEVQQRMIALWAVAGSALRADSSHFRAYIVDGGRQAWLTPDELAFLLDDAPTEADVIRYSWRLEALYCLAWCGGLVKKIELPKKQSTIKAILPLLPVAMEAPDALRTALAATARSADAILDWADLLYRVDWALDDARERNKPAPAGVLAGVVPEWRLALDWMRGAAATDEWDDA